VRSEPAGPPPSFACPPRPRPRSAPPHSALTPLTSPLYPSLARAGDRNTYQAHEWDPTNLETLPILFTQNLFLSNYKSIFAIDNDDGSNGYVVTRNLLLWSGAKSLMGYNKHFLSNLYAYADYTPFSTAAARAHDPTLSEDSPALRALARKYELSEGNGVNFCTGSVATGAFAQLGLADQYRGNTCIVSSSTNLFRWYNPCSNTTPTDGSMWLLSDNIYRSADGGYRNACGGAVWNLTEAQALGVDVGSVTTTLPSTDELVAMGKAILGMAAEPVAAEHVAAASAADAAADAEEGTARIPPPPHLVAILIDDWGHNNVGFHARDQANAAEVQTPVIDSLAAQGVVLDRAYAFRFCSPSRSALLTGRNPIHVNVLNSPLAAWNASDAVGGAAGIPRPMTTLAERLRNEAGYFTAQLVLLSTRPPFCTLPSNPSSFLPPSFLPSSFLPPSSLLFSQPVLASGTSA
jgi:hypothetical protein